MTLMTRRKTGGAEALAAYTGHEVLTAERLKWWGVFLVREQRRLLAIAGRVRAEPDDAAVASQPVSQAPTQNETPGDLPARPDAEIDIEDALDYLAEQAALLSEAGSTGVADPDNVTAGDRTMPVQEPASLAAAWLAADEPPLAVEDTRPVEPPPEAAGGEEQSGQGQGEKGY